MIPRTFLSTYAANGQQQMVVVFLDNITGLTRWVDYIPVKLAQGGRENSYDNNGFIDVEVVAPSLTSVPFKDYVPVYADTSATDAWQVNFTGYIPYGYAGSGDASLVLDFTSNFQAFDPRITFNRASSATYFNSAGLLTTAPVNKLLYSAELDNAAWTKNNSSINANVTIGPFGATDADKLVEDTANSTHQVSQSTGSSFPQQHTFSIYAKADTRSVLALTMINVGNARFLNFDLAAGTATGSPIVSFGWSNASASIVPVGNGWYRCILTAISSGTNVIFGAAGIVVGGNTTYLGDGTSGLFLFGAQLQTGPVTDYIPTVATANSTPRLDYNPATLAAQGLLIEEQRVNLLTYSNYFDNAAWSKGNATVTANAITSVTGNVDADKLVENTATSTHSMQQTITVTSGTTYTFTVYAKAGERQKLYLVGSAAGFTANQAIYNLSTGVISSIVACTATMSSVGNGWYRCVWTATANANASTTFNIFLDNGTTNSYTGDGVSGIYLYGAQLEAGSFATSYAPSVNTFTSRASTGSFFDATGTLQSAAINVARNTYNPANLAAQPFLLLEEARTNSIRNNTMVGAVAGTPGTLPTNWASFTPLTGLTTQVVGTGTESGVTYIDFRLSGTPSAAGPFLVFFESGAIVSASNGQLWNSSSYAKLAGGSLSGVTSFELVITERSAVAELARSGQAFTPTSANLSTQRVNVTRTNNNVATIYELSFIQFNLSGVAIDITLRIGLPQLELGAFATSVIPTSTTALTRSADISSSSQATRAADVANVNTLSPWFNASEGTLYAEYIATNSAQNNAATSLSDNTNDNRMIIRATNSASQTVFLGVASTATQWNDTIATALLNTTTKSAFGYAANNIAWVRNGGTVGTDTTATIPTVSRLQLGLDGAGTFPLNGYLRRITYYPRRLSDAELQTLTT